MKNSNLSVTDPFLYHDHYVEADKWLIRLLDSNVSKVSLKVRFLDLDPTNKDAVLDIVYRKLLQYQKVGENKPKEGLSYDSKYKICIYYLMELIEQSSIWWFSKPLHEMVNDDKSYDQFQHWMNEKFFGEWKLIIWEDPVTKKDVATSYAVNKVGDVQNVVTGKILRPGSDGHGYLHVEIFISYIDVTVKLYRVVAKMFIPNPKGLPEVNHINGIKTCNCVENLEWVTHQENMQHAVDNKLVKYKTGFDSPICTFTKDDPAIQQMVELMENHYSANKIGEILGTRYGLLAGGIIKGRYTEFVKEHPDILNSRQYYTKPKEFRQSVTLLAKNHDNDYIIKALKLPDDRTTRRYINDRRRYALGRRRR